jgi:hypothetical protein
MNSAISLPLILNLLVKMKFCPDVQIDVSVNIHLVHLKYNLVFLPIIYIFVYLCGSKMVAETYVLPDRSQLISLNTDIKDAAECVRCYYKQRQLNDILLQLKSLQNC